jgi:hypothetical protein
MGKNVDFDELELRAIKHAIDYEIYNGDDDSEYKEFLFDIMDKL